MRRAMRSRFCSSVRGMGQFTVDSLELKEKRALIERFRWGLALNPHPLKIAKGAAPAKGRLEVAAWRTELAELGRSRAASVQFVRTPFCMLEFICGWCGARCA